MSENLVKKTTKDTVLVLEMNDPAARNALSRDMLSGLSAAIGNVGADILSIVITGGIDCFSAGGDFRELKGTSEDLDYDDAVSGVVALILASDRVIVAAIEGPCMGAAADIALACDYRVAGAGSFMQIPAVRLGLLYSPAAIERIRRLYPRDTVRRLLLAGERFDAHEARRAGLYSRVVPTGESVSVAVRDLRKLDWRQADAVRATKQLLSDLEAGQADTDHWQKRRIELLDSEQRHIAIKQAHERFVDKHGPHR
ncbi:enoyl-CoA hydratase/isomerase family protein [Paraburkholderia denitrificans]|uniref:Enoyl-CoA hydratase/isomerase family protein n=1 Tax=Paraburkholderia denitrificans TaxID=694025 RepID=A0ABW0J352_9BURK